VFVGRVEKTIKKQHEHSFGRELKASRRERKKPSFVAQMKRLIMKAWLDIILEVSYKLHCK